MSTQESKKISMSAGLAAAFTWFGYHCGSGFATGTTMAAYVTKYGYYGLFIPITAFIGLGMFFYLAAEYSRRTGCQSYKDYAAKLFIPKYPFIFILIWDAIFVLAAVATLGVVFSGGASLLQKQYNISYFVGLAFFVGACAAVVCLASEDFVRKAVGILAGITVPMIILLLITIVMTLSSRMGELTAVLASPEAKEGFTFMTAIKGGINYMGLQGTSIGAIIAIATTFTGGKRDTKTAVSVGVVLNAGLMLGVSLVMMTAYPAINIESLPVLSVINMVPNSGLLSIVYQITLILAFLSTGGGVLLNQMARFQNVGKNVIKSEVARRRFWAALFCVVSAVLASFGILWVVSKAYGLVAKLTLPFVVIATFIFAPYRLYKMTQAEKSGASVPAE